VRNIDAKEVTKTVTRLLIEANYYLPDDVLEALQIAQDTEESVAGKKVLSQLRMQISPPKSRWRFARIVVSR
jgi:fumarate hydratase subunit alpha